MCIAGSDELYIMCRKFNMHVLLFMILTIMY